MIMNKGHVQTLEAAADRLTCNCPGAECSGTCTLSELLAIISQAQGRCGVCEGAGAYQLDGETTDCRNCGGTGFDQNEYLVMSEQEFDTVLHSLRLYQEQRDPDETGKKDDGYFYRHPSLSDEGLEDFIERINTKPEMLEPCKGRELTAGEATEALGQFVRDRSPLQQENAVRSARTKETGGRE